MFRPLLVALLALLLVVPPVLADDGEQSPEPGPSSDPAPESSPGSEGEAGGEPAGNQTTDPESRQASQAEQPSCRIIANHILDNSVPKSQWIIVDPDGCVRDTIERLIERPVSFVRR